jgi:hypothetical protein
MEVPDMRHLRSEENRSPRVVARLCRACCHGIKSLALMSKFVVWLVHGEIRIYLIAGKNRLKSLAFCAARPHIVAVR